MKYLLLCQVQPDSFANMPAQAGEPEATGWAAKCPAAKFGALEVRQVAYSPL